MAPNLRHQIRSIHENGASEMPMVYERHGEYFFNKECKGKPLTKEQRDAALLESSKDIIKLHKKVKQEHSNAYALKRELASIKKKMKTKPDAQCWREMKYMPASARRKYVQLKFISRSGPYHTPQETLEKGADDFNNLMESPSFSCRVFAIHTEPLYDDDGKPHRWQQTVEICWRGTLASFKKAVKNNAFNTRRASEYGPWPSAVLRTVKFAKDFNGEWEVDSEAEDSDSDSDPDHKHPLWKSDRWSQPIIYPETCFREDEEPKLKNLNDSIEVTRAMRVLFEATGKWPEM